MSMMSAVRAFAGVSSVVVLIAEALVASVFVIVPVIIESLVLFGLVLIIVVAQYVHRRRGALFAF